MKSDYAKLASRTTLAISLLLAALLALAGCGGSQEQGSQGGGQGSQEEETTTAAAPEKTGGSTMAAAQGGDGGATAEVVEATEAWLATLDDAQREEATFDDVLHIHSVYRDPTNDYGEPSVAG